MATLLIGGSFDRNWRGKNLSILSISALRYFSIVETIALIALARRFIRSQLIVADWSIGGGFVLCPKFFFSFFSLSLSLSFKSNYIDLKRLFIVSNLFTSNARTLWISFFLLKKCEEGSFCPEGFFYEWVFVSHVDTWFDNFARESRIRDNIYNTLRWEGVRVYLEGEFIHRIVYTISAGQTIVLDLRHTAQC